MRLSRCVNVGKEADSNVRWLVSIHEWFNELVSRSWLGFGTTQHVEEQDTVCACDLGILSDWQCALKAPLVALRLHGRCTGDGDMGNRGVPCTGLAQKQLLYQLPLAS